MNFGYVTVNGVNSNVNLSLIHICNIQPATAVALAKNVKNIVGIKAASGDLSQIATMMSMAECYNLYGSEHCT